MGAAEERLPGGLQALPGIIGGVPVAENGGVGWSCGQQVCQQHHHDGKDGAGLHEVPAEVGREAQAARAPHANVLGEAKAHQQQQCGQQKDDQIDNGLVVGGPI